MIRALFNLLGRVAAPAFGAAMGGTPRSPEWAKVRAAYLKLHPTCAACGVREKLEVHHVVPFHQDRLKELDPDNFITLCETAGNCHLTFGHLRNWSSWNVDVRADAAAYLKKVKGRPGEGGRVTGEEG